MYNSTVNDHLFASVKGWSSYNFIAWIKAHTCVVTSFAGVSIASVARRLGHASMNTTQKTYLHIIQELENKDVDIVMRSLAGL